MTGLTPDITDAQVLRHGRLRLTFADGLVGEVDVLERMHGPAFAAARTPEGFARVEPRHFLRHSSSGMACVNRAGSSGTVEGA
jgi:hypothetical protein